jgi:hypothetical protein
LSGLGTTGISDTATPFSGTPKCGCAAVYAVHFALAPWGEKVAVSPSVDGSFDLWTDERRRSSLPSPTSAGPGARFRFPDARNRVPFRATQMALEVVGEELGLIILNLESEVRISAWMCNS